MSEENAQVGVETTETVETLTAKLEAEAAARAKAEAKIVDMKKSTTPAKEPKEEVKTETVGFDEEAFERKYEEKKFFESNPDMVEYKDQLSEFTSKGIGFEQAKLLVENSDETIKARKNIGKTNFTTGYDPKVSTTITKEQLENASSQGEYNKMKDDIESGKVTLI